MGYSRNGSTVWLENHEPQGGWQKEGRSWITESNKGMGWSFDFILSTEHCNQGSGMTWITYLKGHFGCIIGK